MYFHHIVLPMISHHAQCDMRNLPSGLDAM